MPACQQPNDVRSVEESLLANSNAKQMALDFVSHSCAVADIIGRIESRKQEAAGTNATPDLSDGPFRASPRKVVQAETRDNHPKAHCSEREGFSQIHLNCRCTSRRPCALLK